VRIEIAHIIETAGPTLIGRMKEMNAKEIVSYLKKAKKISKTEFIALFPNAEEVWDMLSLINSLNLWIINE